MQNDINKFYEDMNNNIERYHREIKKFINNKLLDITEINDDLVENLVYEYKNIHNNKKKITGFTPVEIRNISDKVVIEMITNKMIRSIIKKKVSLEDLLDEGEKLLFSDAIKLYNYYSVKDLKVKQQNFSVPVIFLNYPSDLICRVKIAINNFQNFKKEIL